MKRKTKHSQNNTDQKNNYDYIWEAVEYCAKTESPVTMQMGTPMTTNLTWQKFYPFSDKNAFICLVDKMGDDSSIVQAARVSFDGDAPVGRAISSKSKKKILTDNEFSTLLENTKAILALPTISYDQDSMFVVYYNETESVRIKENSSEYEIVLQLYEQQLIEDRHLIRYLMNHAHTTPFEMVEFKFMVQVPMDCWRQWIRHRTASINEYSTRYTEALDFFQVTSPEEWRTQSTDNKQGSSGFVKTVPMKVYQDGEVIEKQISLIDGQTPGQVLSENELEFHDHAKRLYKQRLDWGIAKEQARKDLPLSTYTRAYWKCDLHNIFNFLRLRMDSHAQLEIRSFANCMFEIVKQVCPVACEAFEDYVLHAKKFSRMEMEIIKFLISDYEFKNSALKPASMTDREWKEFLAKLS